MSRHPHHISDWAARCAKFIGDGERTASVHRLATIISHYAEELEEMLQKSKRECTGPFCVRGYTNAQPQCVCGAEEWNRKVDEVLK